MEILTLLIAAAIAAYWAKNRLANSPKPSSIEIFPSRGVTFVKRTLKSCANRYIGHESPTSPFASESQSAPSDYTPPVSESSICKPDAERQSPIETNTVVAEKTEQSIPQDSVLRRHYLAKLAAEQVAVTNPYPTDSVLRRHYEQLITASVTANVIDIPEFDSRSEDSDANQLAAVQAKPGIPEDSVLKRHFVTQLQTEIEKNYAPCPSDAVLRRHYVQMVQSRLQSSLDAL